MLSESEELELLQLRKKRAMAAGAPSDEPGILQKAAQLVTTPIRGMRGAGVGAELLLNKAFDKDSTNTFGAPDPQSFSQIAERAAEATKPGYVPKYGERAGAAAGEIIATAPVMSATAGGGLMAQSLKGALSSGALTAVMEASERGDVEVSGVGISTVLGGTIPFISPTLRAVARAIRGTAKVATTTGNTLGRDAVDEFMADPKLLQKYKGTAESVGKKVTAIQEALVRQLDDAGGRLQRVREKFGIGESFDDAMERVKTDGFKAPDEREIMKRFPLLTQDTIPAKMVKDAKRGDLGEKAQALMKQVAPGKALKEPFVMNPKERLRELYSLRHEIDDRIKYPAGSAEVPKVGTLDQGLLKKMREQVNAAIERTPGGKTLRRADKFYADARELYDNFRNQIAEQGKAEDLIRRIVKGEDLGDVVGRKGTLVGMVKRVEKKARTPLLEPAKKEFAARSFHQMGVTGPTGIPSEFLGADGIANILRAARGAAAIPDAAAVPFGTPTMRSLLQAAAVNKTRNQRRP